MAPSSSSAPNVVNEETATTVKRTAAADDADAAPPVKRRRLTFAASPPPPSPSSSSQRAVRGARTRTPTRATSSSVKVKAAPCLARSPTRTRFFAGRAAARRPVRVTGIRTPGTTTSSSSVKAASRAASRSAGKTSTPGAGRGTPRMAATTNSKHWEAKSRQLRDGRISSEMRKELTEGRDAAATIAASVLQEASIFDSLFRNESEFSEICDSAKVSCPLPTVDPFLGVYQDTIQWKNIAESAASVELSSPKYWVGGAVHVVHELSLPNAPKTNSRAKARTAELAKKLCGQMQRWFLAFVEEALDVENKWKHSSDTPTLLSQFEKISDWLEQVQHHQIMEEEEVEMIKRLKNRIGHNLRRLKEWGSVPPRTQIQSRRCHQ